MACFSFSKLIPGGNPTVILHDPALEPGSLPGIAARLMSPLHIGGEQAGALYSDGAPPYLEMMGGEFCVNASRAAAMLLARQNLLERRTVRGVPVWGGLLRVSGADEPVRVLVSPSAKALESAMSRSDTGQDAKQILGTQADERADPAAAVLHCAARVECGSAVFECQPMQQGVCLVRMPGMDHLLVDTRRHALPDLNSSDWKKESAAWRLLCGLSAAPASGVIWYARHGRGYRIWPAVSVLATESEYLESACGSASMALALAALHKCIGDEPGEAVTDILQPSGETLRVMPQGERNNRTAWVAGPVSIAAQGTAFL